MNLIRFALRKPISILVLVAGLFFFGIGAVRSIKVDILPKLDLPVVYLLHPFPGYTPDQMEAFFGKQYVNVFAFVNGVKAIETKNVQGLTMMKLSFFPGTNMAQAAAEVSAFSNRIQAAFPASSQPPFIIRFDASTIPVGQLVASSETRPINELLDLTQTYVRASLISIPGLSASPAFGGNLRTVEINIDPEALHAHNMTPDQVVLALRQNTQTSPSGNVRIGDKNYIASANTIIRQIDDFGNIPLYKNTVGNLYLKDIASIRDGSDVTAGYALINGKRSVFLSIAKSADASTWEVVSKLKEAMPKLQAQLPDDVKLTYEFDQSTYVINAVHSLMEEGIIGAVLTGLMVLLFLKDWRGAVIVILTIPTSIISGVLFLNLFGQTINIMTLSGLALAIGILVDESTVTIENIHQHFAMGKPKAQAIWDACKEIAYPKLLILLCILAVFAPAFTMQGISGSLFLPLALAIGFSMIVSYFMSQTFLPVVANYLMKINPKHLHHEDNNHKKSGFDKLRDRFLRFINRLMPRKRFIGIFYLVATTGLVVLLLNSTGRDVLPKVNSKQFQLRLRAPEGTRVEETERKVIKATKLLESMVGKENIGITSSFIGMHPSQFVVSYVYLWSPGPQEALMQVALTEDYDTNMEELKQQFRELMQKEMPEMALSFEPIEMTDKILSQGSPTAVEVRIGGRNKKLNREYAQKVVDKLKEIEYMRDVKIVQSQNYPGLKIDIDRVRAAQLNTDVTDISRSLVASTSSSRYTEKLYWIDEKSNLPYNVQVEVPEYQMSSINDVSEISLTQNNMRPVLGDVADITETKLPGESDNLGAMPILTVGANIHQTDLGTASDDVKEALASLGELPRGLTIETMGLTTVLDDTLNSLQSGLLVAIVVIFLMLAANFQSFKVSAVILTTVPAVVFGSLLLLLITGSTLNLQSYMGIIMSVGVSISNAVLLITNAEDIRRRGASAIDAAKEAVSLRLRPILMTSIAMVAGMIPMASGMGDAGDQVSPLGRAVIGGLIASTFSALIVLPLIFAWAQNKAGVASVSLDPEDKESKFYEESPEQYEK